MSRYQLTPIPEVRSYGVDQVFPDGRRHRIDTFPEDERLRAIKLVALLNRGRRWSTSTAPRSSSSASSLESDSDS